LSVIFSAGGGIFFFLKSVNRQSEQELMISNGKTASDGYPLIHH